MRQVSDALQRRVFGHVLVQQLAVRPGSKGRYPHEHFPQNAAQRVKVGATVDLSSLLALLRTRVERRTAKPNGLRVDLRARAFSAEASREPEVNNLDLPSVRVRVRPQVRYSAACRQDHEVGRLQVAMDDMLFMDGGQSTGDLRSESDGHHRRQRTACAQPIRQRFACDEFHRIEKIPRCVVEVDHACDIRMTDSRRGARLAQEECLCLRIPNLPGRDHFQRHVDPQPLIIRPVRHPHRASTQFPNRTIGPPQDAIMRECQFLTASRVRLGLIRHKPTLSGQASVGNGSLRPQIEPTDSPPRALSAGADAVHPATRANLLRGRRHSCIRAILFARW